MRIRRPARALPGLLCVLAAAACGGAGGGPEAPAPRPADTSAAEGDQEIEALWRARLDSARTAFTDADVRFMRGMIHHHAQALEMTRLVPDRTSSSLVRTLAARITNSQRDEIATMQRWLTDRDLEVPEIHPTGHHTGPTMPGMLTVEQMRELGQASGETFDRLFLRYMIQHHRGAVVMVRDLFATDGAAQDEAVFRFASDVRVDQDTEIARMERMLAELAGPSR